ncbi:MAG: superoxide dismutase family protein [Candidatus Saccharimonadaceae bacterium]|nr:superoxide dismutase family protein [Candidatus Saccharimonadaceae bacterium]
MSFDFMSLNEVICREIPVAYAPVQGNVSHSELRGNVLFYQIPGGLILCADVVGLPMGEGLCGSKIFGFHIHEGGSCTGNATDPFANVGGHYNPYSCPHPEHAGDLPPLFGNNGYAWTAFATNRFTLDEIIGRTIIIHNKPDDFTTQPSGNSGEKIACGIIQKCNKL